MRSGAVRRVAAKRDDAMSKWEKLIQRILSLSNDIRYEELRKVLESFGYTEHMPRGGSSHRTFRKRDAAAVTIPVQRPVKRVYVEKVAEVITREMGIG